MPANKTWDFGKTWATPGAGSMAHSGTLAEQWTVPCALPIPTPTPRVARWCQGLGLLQMVEEGATAAVRRRPPGADPAEYRPSVLKPGATAAAGKSARAHWRRTARPLALCRERGVLATSLSLRHLRHAAPRRSTR